MTSAQDAQRQHGDAGQKQPHVEPDHHADRPGQEQQVSDPRERGLGRHALDLADVVVQARHDVAQPGAGVEAGREALQMAVQIEPHVEQDLRRHAGVAQTAGDVQQEAEQGQADEQRDDAHQHGPVAGEQRVVDQVARQQRDDQRRRGAGEAENHHEGEAPPVRRDVGQRATELGVQESAQNPRGVRPAIHPDSLCCSAVTYSPACSFVAPRDPGASPAAVLRGLHRGLWACRPCGGRLRLDSRQGAVGEDGMMMSPDVMSPSSASVSR